MKRWLVGLLAVGQLHCGGCNPRGEDGGTPSAEPARWPEPVTPDFSEVPRPAPELAVSMNGGGSTRVGTDWPMVFEVAVVHPQAFQSDASGVFVLEGPDGNAHSAFRLVARDGSGAPTAIPAKLDHAPPGAITIDGAQTMKLVYSVAPGGLTLSPGTYTVRAELDTRSASGADLWAGEARSPALTLEVLPQTPAELESSRAWVTASYWRLKGNPTQAMAEVEKRLQTEPLDIDALALRGDLEEAAGQLEAALASYNAALEAFYALGVGGVEAPRILLRRRAELLGRVYGP